MTGEEGEKIGRGEREEMGWEFQVAARVVGIISDKDICVNLLPQLP